MGNRLLIGASLALSEHEGGKLLRALTVPAVVVSSPTLHLSRSSEWDRFQAHAPVNVGRGSQLIQLRGPSLQLFALAGDKLIM